MKNIQPIETILLTQEKHVAFVDAIIEQMELEIGKLSMIKGLFVKKTYAAVKSVRPGYVKHIIEVLSKDYVSEFSQMHAAYREEQKLPSEKPASFYSYVEGHKAEAEKHFWAVADRYASRKSESLIGKAYKAGRSTIESHLPLVFKVICAEIDRFTFEDV